MEGSELNVVTGAFGFTGRHITRRLLDMGKQVKTITCNPDRSNEFGSRVTAEPFNFDNPSALTETLRGADTLFNTYWIRFPRGEVTFEKAIENSKLLIQAAIDAGVRKFVYISAINPSIDSPFPYCRGKAIVEEAIKQSGMSYAILRPAVIFGDQGLLINNIAWFLRHSPVFGVPGDGRFRIQSILVDDLAQLAVEAAAINENIIMDALGPETYTFNDLLKMLKNSLGSRTILVHMPPAAALLVTHIIGILLGDVILTRDEVNGMTSGLLASDQPPRGHTHLSEWVQENKAWLGRKYVSDLKAHFK